MVRQMGAIANLGVAQESPGPFMSDETAERIAFVGGWVLAGGALILLLALLVQAWS
jgi:hypothetical protein